MIQTISQIIEPCITSLCWVGMYGGYMRPCPTQTQNGTLYFPVPCGMQMEECHKHKGFFTPGPDKVSVVFLSETKSEEYECISKGLWKVSGYFNINVWVNPQKIGLSCSDNFYFDMMNKLKRAKLSNDIASLNILKIEKYNDRSEFEQFTYGTKLSLFTHPYSWFTLRVRYEMNISPQCLLPIECGEEIECISWV